MIDTVRLAILQSEVAEFPNTGIVINTIDWGKIELTKDGEGRYIFANVQGNATPTLWGRPVVATNAMTIDKFLTGAFRLGAQVFDREDANVEVSTEDSDNFRKNLVTIRAEERLVLAVYRPQAFIYGDFGQVT
jgi:HK97 family phage major capsid protein